MLRAVRVLLALRSRPLSACWTRAVPRSSRISRCWHVSRDRETRAFSLPAPARRVRCINVAASAATCASRSREASSSLHRAAAELRDSARRAGGACDSLSLPPASAGRELRRAAAKYLPLLARGNRVALCSCPSQCLPWRGRCRVAPTCFIRRGLARLLVAFILQPR